MRTHAEAWSNTLLWLARSLAALAEVQDLSPDVVVAKRIGKPFQFSVLIAGRRCGELQRIAPAVWEGEFRGRLTQDAEEIESGAAALPVTWVRHWPIGFQGVTATRALADGLATIKRRRLEFALQWMEEICFFAGDLPREISRAHRPGGPLDYALRQICAALDRIDGIKDGERARAAAFKWAETILSLAGKSSN